MTLPAIAVLSFAQSPPRPEFEVASIKPNTSENGLSSTRPGPTELYLENTSLRKCIALAYNVSEDRDSAISAPDWLNFERYDLAAKYPAGTPLEQVRVMLQNLLADRFKLKLHRESKEVPIYALVAAKRGPKLTASAPGDRRVPRGRQPRAPRQHSRRSVEPRNAGFPQR